jgi:hypothetical protein
VAASAKTQKFKARVDKFPGEGLTHYIPVPKRVFGAMGGKYNTRVSCTVNGKLTFACALISAGPKVGGACIFLSKQRMKEVKTERGSLVSVELKPDKSRYGMPLSPELRECLKQDPEAKRRFDAISPGKQRNIIFFVGQLKHPDRRTDRAFRILERLKAISLGARGKEFSSIFKSGDASPLAQVRDHEEFLKKILPISALKKERK